MKIPGTIRLFLVVCLTVYFSHASGSIFAEDAPPLPSGLEEPEENTGNEEPALPNGLDSGETKNADAPALPTGLETDQKKPDNDDQEPEDDSWREQLPFDLTGFWEARAGIRTQGDPHEKTWSLAEERLQLQADKAWDKAALRLTGDFLYDPVLDEHAIDLDYGQGWLDLREASLLLRPVDFMDLKFGRQILTWGTGDMLFINDLFPKDWNSFFIGRDDEYLKSPSDAIKLSLFSKAVNLDIVYTPCFDSDRFIDGRRISYYNSTMGRRAGRDAVVRPVRRAEWFETDEWSARMYRNIHGYELAFYLYNGYWKSPRGMERSRPKAFFPRLSVYGFSARGPLLGGIANVEAGYYDSRQDRDGDDPFIANNQLRMLFGFERELAKDFTAGLQYYVEWQMQQDDYQHSMFAGTREMDEIRQVITLRLTRLLMEQNLTLSLFTYYSPTDRDIYLRPKINYRINDQWTVEFGGNVFCGADQHTFFGQFEKNSNIYLSLRWGF